MKIKEVVGRPRGWINKHSSIFVLIAVPVIIGSILSIASHRDTPKEPARNGFYYDLDSDTLFVAPTMNVPSARTADSTPEFVPAGARAYVFACNDCADMKDRYVGWLEFYSQAAVERFKHPEAPPAEGQCDEGRFILKPDPANPDWKTSRFEFMSIEAAQIIAEAPRKCGGNREPQRCAPPGEPMP